MGKKYDKRKARTPNLNNLIKQLGICTKKVRYETEEEAQFEADTRYLEYYQCGVCKHYHLTQRNDNENPKTYTY